MEAGSGSVEGGPEVARNHVQQLREALMLSKAELARRASLSTLTIDRVEAGKSCRLDTKRKILFALGLKVQDKDRVFGGSPVEFDAAKSPPEELRAEQVGG